MIKIKCEQNIDNIINKLYITETVKTVGINLAYVKQAKTLCAEPGKERPPPPGLAGGSAAGRRIRCFILQSGLEPGAVCERYVCAF